MAKNPLPSPRVASAPIPRPSAPKAPVPPVKEKAPPADEKPKTEPPKTDKPKKSKKAAKKSAIASGVKTATLLDGHARRLLDLTANWEGEATPDQQDTNAEIVANLVKVAPLAKQILLDIDMLHRSGFNPTAVRGGGAPLMAGMKVVIKTKFYEPAAYGAVNQFDVVLVVGRFVRLRSTADPKQPQIVVPRGWVDPADEVEVDDTLPEGVDPDADPEAAPEADGGVDQDGDPDHRLPNEDLE